MRASGGGRWLEQAEKDVKMAELALAQGMFDYVCFHSQQAVEKALKGLLLARVGRYPRSHSLEELAMFDEAVRREFEGRREEFREVDSYYLSTRYPDAAPGPWETGEPMREDAEKALQVARAMVADIRSRMRAV